MPLLGALYQALVVAFMVGAYAGESSYYLHERERHSLSLESLAERYGGGSQQGEGVGR